MNHAFRSIWGALLWKEWRQQRLPLLFLACFSLAGYLAYCQTMGEKADLAGVTMLLLLLSPCLGASTFASESDDQTDAFVTRLPLPAWRLLLVKYAVALGLVFLCVMPAAMVHVFLGVTGTEDHGWMSELGDVLLLVSGAVAVAGALARQGMGAMGALLATGGLCFAGVVLFLPLTQAAGGQASDVQTVIPVAWCVAHLWLFRVWLGRRMPARARWRLGVGPILLLLVPVVPALSTIAYQRILMGPRQWLQQATCIETVPSPDGRTIALATRTPSRTPIGNSAAWLLDVDTGRISRVGPRWQDCRFGSWPSRRGWSPDGSQTLLYTSPARFLGRVSEKEEFEAIKEWTLEVFQDRGTLTKQGPRPGYLWSGWLGDGTRVTYTPKAWEFEDRDTGEVRRCLSPPAKDNVDGKWYGVRKFWLDHAIVAVDLDNRTGTSCICRVWRSAPDLSRTDRHDFPLAQILSSSDLHPVALSGDGRWLLIGRSRGGRPPLWLVSLADGASRLVEPKGGDLPRGGMFTPDSSLLVIPGTERLHVWNLAAAKWEPATPLPEEAQLHASRNDPNNPSYAISPGRPWRVALRCSVPTAVFVLDLEKHSADHVFPQPGSNAWVSRVWWLGNDRLLVRLAAGTAQLWVVEADGSGSRQVLP